MVAEKTFKITRSTSIMVRLNRETPVKCRGKSLPNIPLTLEIKRYIWIKMTRRWGETITVLIPTRKMCIKGPKYA